MSEPSVDAEAFDVAVVGAGPAGAATATWLAKRGLEILLVERGTFDQPRVGETLAPAVRPLLSELGVWDRFLALAPLPSWGTRSMWGGPDPAEHSHLGSPYGCGWHVDRRRFDQMLADAAVTAGASLRTGVRVVDCEQQDRTGWRLTLASEAGGRQATARAVVDATGRGARLARRLGGRRLVFDRLIAVAAAFEPVAGEPQCFTLVETTAQGWWYSAPVGGDRLMGMLMTDGDLCGRAGLTSIETWLSCLQLSPFTAARAGDALVAWGPQVFSAVSQRLRRDEPTAPWLAVGDAALAVDPVSGSGVLRALRTASAGAAAVLDLLDGASNEVVEHYEAERDRECLQYLQERADYYGAEPRWRGSPFWQRRVA